MSTATKAGPSARDAAAPPAAGPPKRKPAHPLPSPRIKNEKCLEMLRALASASTDHGNREPQPINNNVLGEILDMAPTTVATANPFFSDVGLIVKGVGGYVPCPEVVEYHRRYEWQPEVAAEALRPVFEASWLGKALVPKLRIRSMTEDEAIFDLAEAAKAGLDCKGQLATLLFFLTACGSIVNKDGKYQAAKSASRNPESNSRPSATEDDADDEQSMYSTFTGTGTGASTGTGTGMRSPFGLVGDQGAVQFNIAVQVDMKEFAGWSADRITAFFGGIAQVLAAKGDD